MVYKVYGARGVVAAQRPVEPLAAVRICSGTHLVVLEVYMNDKMSNKTIASVELSLYDPAWGEMFRREEIEIRKVIGEHIERVEHIGSTSIEGLAAKPEIDLLIGVRDITDAEKCIVPLRDFGYVYFSKFEQLVPERRYFRKSEGIKPLFHIHMVETKSSFYEERILFRDYLRSHKEMREEYEKLKRILLQASNGDRGTYQDGKKEFVERIVTLAKE